MKDEALKLALEAITRYLSESPNPSEEAVEGLCDAASVARKVLAQPAQEPVEITKEMALSFHRALTDGPIGASEIEEIKTGLAASFAHITTPLAQRTWVGLTDEEIFSVLGNLQRKYNGPPTEDSRVVFALAIEAKLKEKNA
jgi:hypothetical protein